MECLKGRPDHNRKFTTGSYGFLAAAWKRNISVICHAMAADIHSATVCRDDDSRFYGSGGQRNGGSNRIRFPQENCPPSQIFIVSDGVDLTIGDSTFEPCEIHSLAKPAPIRFCTLGPTFGRFTQMRFPDCCPWELTVSWLVPSIMFALLSYFASNISDVNGLPKAHCH